MLAPFAGRRAAFSFKTRVAIRRACDVLGLRPGDEVLAPAYNCGSELDPLLAARLAVRLYPVGPDAIVDPGTIGTLIGPRTRAVYLTHYFGFLQPATAAIRALCAAHGLRLIEDCALSLLSGQAPVEGRAGDVAVFCFSKFFPVIGGGGLVVNAPDLSDPAPFARPAPAGMVGRHILRSTLERMLGPGGIARLKRQLRRTPPAPPPETGGRPDMPSHYYFDSRLAETRISRLTLRALRGLDPALSIAARRSRYLQLRDLLQGLPGIAPLFTDLPPEAVPLGLPLVVDPARRGPLVRGLQAEGIGATPWWEGYHRKLDFTGQTDGCRLKDSVLFLPTHPWLADNDIKHCAWQLAVLLSR